MPEYNVEAKNVVRTFKGASGSTVQALNEVSLDVKPGEIFGLLGPNGAGKTTLIKILTTLLLPTSGEAYVGGFNVVTEAAKIRGIINLVSGGETPGYGILNVRENLWFFSQLYGLPNSIANDRISQLLEELDLKEYASTRMSKLSTGYKQRLNLARGFVNDPQVVFLDEPTLGLDIISAKNLRRFVLEWIKKTANKSLLLTTHYMAEADELCNRVAIIDRGRILANDTPERLKNKVRKNTTVKLELEGKVDSSELQKVPMIVGFAESHDIQTGVTSIKVVVESDSAISDILSQISKNGLKVLGVSKTEPTLEDVYISLVGRGFEETESATQ